MSTAESKPIEVAAIEDTSLLAFYRDMNLPERRTFWACASGWTLDELRAKGHEVIEPLGQTSANSIAVTPNGLLGAPDPRTRGAEAAGQ